MVYLVKGGGWMTAGKAFSVLSGLGLAAAFANLIPKETYGTYKFIVSVASIISLFTLSNINTALTQAVASGSKQILRSAKNIKLRWNIGIITAGLIAVLYYYLQGNLTLAIGVGMITVFYPVRTAYGIYSDYLKGIKDFRRTSFYNIGSEAFEILLMITTLFFTNSIYWILLAFFATNTIASLFFYYQTVSVYPQKKPKKRDRQELLSYSKHLSLIKVIQRAAQYIDKVLVWHFLGATQLAIYSFATLPIEKARGFLRIIGSLALPKFSEKNMDTLQKTLPRKLLIFFGTCILAAVGLIIILPFAFDLLFSQYMSSLPFAQVFAVSIIFLPSMLYGNALAAQKKKKEIYVASIGKNVLKIIGIVIFLPIYGLWGAIIVLILEQLIELALKSYLFSFSCK